MLFFESVRVLMDQDLGVRESRLQLGLDGIGHLMRPVERHLAIHLQVQLDEEGRPGGARAQVVEIQHVRMRTDDRLDAIALLVRQLTVHQHVECFARDLAGTVVLVGVPSPDMKIELPMLEVFGRGGALKSSWYGDCLPSRDFPMFIDLHLQGRLDLDRFVSETIALDDVEEAFHKMERGEVLRSVVMM